VCIVDPITQGKSHDLLQEINLMLNMKRGKEVVGAVINHFFGSVSK